MIARLLVTLALAAALLSGCEGIVIVPWYLPHTDHTLQCEGDTDSGECSDRITPGKGTL